VHIDNLRKDGKEDAPAVGKTPLIEKLHEYPVGGVDLGNIVEFPPKVALIPVKPIFLDVAWNYIDYPGKAPQAAAEPAKAAASGKEPEQQQPTKRGWFGFGRS
jgi:signal recognition particle subunit SRP68